MYYILICILYLYIILKYSSCQRLLCHVEPLSAYIRNSQQWLKFCSLADARATTVAVSKNG